MCLKFVVSALLVMSLWSCKDSATNSNKGVANIDSTQGIWSVKSYMDDEWRVIKNENYVLLKTVEENGKIDSSYVQLNEAGFEEIRAFFDPTDINHETFRNVYQVSENSDFGNAYIFFNYDALSEDLLTQKVNIGFHDETMKIISLYIETQKQGLFKSEFKKLNYNTHKSIVIQEDTKKMFGDDVRRVIRYYYSY